MSRAIRMRMYNVGFEESREIREIRAIWRNSDQAKCRYLR